MKKLMKIAFVAASIVSIVPLAASAQDASADAAYTGITRIETVANLEDQQWTSEHATEAESDPTKFATEWREHDALRLVRLDQGGN
ncbi:MAG: hypothetical protein ACREMT_04620 [Vulcanimicrobiaceae bacterium]